MDKNTLAETPIELVTETPDLEIMDRGDSLAIWTGYREEFEKLKGSIETVLASDPALPANAKIARVNRLELRKVRIAIEHRRKELGDSYLRKTKAINSAAKELKDLIEPYEAKLEAIEDHAANVEAQRIAEISQERTAQLSQCGGAIDIPGLGFMPDDQFNSLLEGAKMVHAAKIEAEKRAEADRIAKEKAEADERERIRLENEKLKKEAAEKEAALVAERAKVEAAAKIERIAKEKAESEIERARKEKESQELATKKARDEAELAPDREKIMTLAASVRALQVPNIKSARGREIIAAKIEELAAWVESASQNLKSTK